MCVCCMSEMTRGPSLRQHFFFFFFFQVLQIYIERYIQTEREREKKKLSVAPGHRTLHADMTYFTIKLRFGEISLTDRAGLQKTPRWVKICCKSFQTKTCLDLCYTLSPPPPPPPLSFSLSLYILQLWEQFQVQTV